jgi:hypothetical protein
VQQVIARTKPNFLLLCSILVLVFPLVSLGGCSSLRSDQHSDWVPEPYKISPKALAEIEDLNRHYYLSNESKYWIYGLMTQQCLYAEYHGLPCQYPVVNYPRNPREIK